MKRSLGLLSFFIAIEIGPVCAQRAFEIDTIKTEGGNIEMTFIGHGSLMFTFNGKVIYVDPVRQFADFSRLPKADLILVTHEHGDHLDSAAIATLRRGTTAILLTQRCAPFVPGSDIMRNGERRSVQGFGVEAIPAYNIVNMRSAGNPYHPKGSGNGYVVTLGGVRVYVAGDTENIPEMSNLGVIDYAFLPMNLPYTMTPAMVAEAAKRMKPRVLYPYHFGNTDTNQLVALLSDDKAIEVRIRPMK